MYPPQRADCGGRKGDVEHYLSETVSTQDGVQSARGRSVVISGDCVYSTR